MRNSRYYKYKVIEYAYTSMTAGEGGEKIEVCKTLHKTNSRLIFWMIILSLKIQGIKYSIVKDDK